MSKAISTNEYIKNYHVENETMERLPVLETKQVEAEKLFTLASYVLKHSEEFLNALRFAECLKRQSNFSGEKNHETVLSKTDEVQLAALYRQFLLEETHIQKGKYEFLQFLKEHTCCLVIIESNQLVVYNQSTGIYVDGISVISRIINYFLIQTEIMFLSVKEVLTLYHQSADLIHLDAFDKRGFAFANKTLLFDGELTFVAHSPDYYCLHRSNVVYDPQAICPLFFKTLNELFQSKKATIDFLGEWFGYNIASDLKAQKFLFVQGAGGNGKSLVFAVLRAILGPENVSSSAMEELSQRFGKEILIGKKANICNESFSITYSSETIKALTSGDPIVIDRKNKSQIVTQSQIKLTFILNQLPPIHDSTDAWVRRILFLPFDVKIAPENQDPDLLNKLQSECSGILNWAVEGLKRLRGNHYQFTESEEMLVAKRNYLAQGNPMTTFIEEMIEVTAQTTDRIYKNDMIKAYKSWLSANQLTDVTIGNLNKFWQSFNQSYLQICGAAAVYQKNNNGRFILGVQLKWMEG